MMHNDSGGIRSLPSSGDSGRLTWDLQDPRVDLEHRGLVLVAIAFELFFKEGNFWLGLFFMIAGMVVALFPSNYEIVGMGEDSDAPSDETDS